MKKISHVVVYGISILSVSASAFASGLSKPVNVGPKAIGMGGAFVGVADDPTAIYHNPAGITQIEKTGVIVGADSLITNLEYTPPASATEKAKVEFLPVPFLGVTSDFVKPIYLGLGIFFPHGNGGKFSGRSAVPSNPDEGRIYSMELSPAVAWQITPEWSVGASLRVVRVSSSLKGQALPTGDLLQDINLAGWGVGAAAGFLYKPCKWFSLGGNYRSQVEADLSGNAFFASAPTTPLAGKLTQKLPTDINVGVASSPMEGLTLALGYEFERNSEIKNLTFTSAVGALTLPQNFKDSHTIKLGGEYWITPAIAARAGYAKDLFESIPDTTMNRVVGDISASELSAGGALKWSRYSAALTWNGRFGSRDIPVTATNPGPGHYTAFVHEISASFGFSI